MPTRELLIVCLLVTLSPAARIKAHILGTLRLGNSKATPFAAQIHFLPFIAGGVVPARRFRFRIRAHRSRSTRWRCWSA